MQTKNTKKLVKTSFAFQALSRWADVDPIMFDENIDWVEITDIEVTRLISLCDFIICMDDNESDVQAATEIKTELELL
jgi:hypothetical protein